MTLELVVASGKGGTGKTFISSNLAFYLNSKGTKAIAVDADVEAPDLALALGGIKEIKWEEKFYGKIVTIDYSRCIGCGSCVAVCRFNALNMENGKPVVDEDLCEGFGACALVCPVKAISFIDIERGYIYRGTTPVGLDVFTGDLHVGEKNSGLLVYNLKTMAREAAYREGFDIIVVDSAAGIGCPVISSISGADLLIIVVEPSKQSLKGALRLMDIADQLNTEAYVIVNKYDLNVNFYETIRREFGERIIGKISYNDIVVEAYARMTPLLKLYPDSKLALEMVDAFNKILEGMRIR